MIETDADRLASIKGLGGQLVRHDDGQFWGIFDNDYQAALADGSVESRGPVLTALMTDVADLRKGAVLTLGTRTFKILRSEPDESTGFTTIYLAR
jgi:hypothetical protein